MTQDFSLYINPAWNTCITRIQADEVDTVINAFNTVQQPRKHATSHNLSTLFCCVKHNFVLLGKVIYYYTHLNGCDRLA